MKNYWKFTQHTLVSFLSIINTPFLESLAFKALIKNALKKKIEAMEVIKDALSKNITNFTCWHV